MRFLLFYLAICSCLVLVPSRSSLAEEEKLTPAQKKELIDIGHGLRGTYYRGVVWKQISQFYRKTRVGRKRIIKREVELEFDREWKKGKPHRRFSIEWFGYLRVDRNGEYVFATKSDDGSCVFLDRILVVDNWGSHHALMKRGSVFLNKGVHPIVVRYYDSGHGASFKLFWAPPGQVLSPIPAKNLTVEMGESS